MMSSSDSFTNLKFPIYEFFLTNIYYNFFLNQPTEKKCSVPIRNLLSFSTAQIEKNSWKKLVKTSDEFVNSAKNKNRIRCVHPDCESKKEVNFTYAGIMKHIIELHTSQESAVSIRIQQLTAIFLKVDPMKMFRQVATDTK